ncbi:Na+/H+ antiporter [Planomicrobium sp. MB-3u-38]|uniref:Na+/H+ antiporter n=1 Tax=Planomicrobium sp. MB-3u-38 TaxID=2058318 RepID=UPI000C7C06B8|nr:Na+/H+ antiporter [Planomicrobium sp. MB-3u-38]PKH10103.1 Na+/H+ antiporter [Planomicrobium sp. MB-3u-38]
MGLLFTILTLLICLLLSNVISNYIPFIPVALVQVSLGLMLVLMFEGISLDIETEWFLLLFIAPLLYNDGHNYPREELWRMRGPILGNAVFLVFLTTIVGGLFIHWMIPEIPLAAAFALAAILSPTDPVAVNGIAKRIHLPKGVLNLVRGESLINDASGLVAFNYAVAAVVTGYFSLQEAVLDFSYKFVAGGIFGLVLALLLIGIRLTLRKQGITDVTFHTLLQILTPFIIFMITEDILQASGVIAVVVAGIVHSLVRDQTATLVAEEQVVTENIWTIILFILNGIVFLLLGMSLPTSMSGILEDPGRGYGLVFFYVFAVGTVILGIRFVWAYLFSIYEFRRGKMPDAPKPNLKTALLISLTGVRGTITMVGVLSIPFLMENGEGFPERPLLLFLAAGTILYTLLLATICLPLLSKSPEKRQRETGKISLEEARRRVLLASLKKIRHEMNEENEAAAYDLIDEYKWRFEQLQPAEGTNAKVDNELERKLKEIRRRGLKAERNFIQKTKENGNMDQDIYEAFEKSFDRREEAASNNVRTVTFYLQGKLRRAWKRFKGYHPEAIENRPEPFPEGRKHQREAMMAAIQDLEKVKDKLGYKELVNEVISDYRQKISRLNNPGSMSAKKYELQKEELRINVLDTGRSEIFRLYESGVITRKEARDLRRFINHIESVTLYEQNE